jgi:tetratricopeptide (TPR) repeat protein
LLSPEEQCVFRQLSVFRGGWSSDAAEAVAGAYHPLLHALMNKSLLRSDVCSASDRRYDMHEVVRQYAHEQLQAAGEMQQVRDRHLGYMLGLAEQVEPQLTGAEQGRWLIRLEAENDNFRAALEWALDQQRIELAARLSAALWRFWTARGYLGEGRSWLARVLAANAPVSPAVQAKALTAAGMLAWGQGDYGQAIERCEQSLALYKELGDDRGIATCFQHLGSLTLHQGDYAQAQALLDASLALRRALGDRWGIALCLANLGALAGRQGNSTQAELCYEESLALLRALGDKERIAVMLDNLGAVARDRGDYDRARKLYGEGLTLLRELNNKWNIPTCLNNLGGIALDQRDYAGARALYAESLPLLQELGDKEGLAVCLEGLAGVASGLEQPAQAARLFGGAERLRTSIGSPLPPVALSRYERLVATTQAQLDPQAFAAAWAEGLALTLDQLIDYAQDAARSSAA